MAHLNQRRSHKYIELMESVLYFTRKTDSTDPLWNRIISQTVA